MALRIASIIVPVKDNKGKPFPDLHQNVEAWLLTVFGGFTATLCIGSWVKDGKRYDDENVKFEVFYHDRSEQIQHLRDIAHRIMDCSDQLAVAIVINGCPATVEKRKAPKLTQVARRGYQNRLDGLNADRAAILRTIAKAEANRPSHGGRSAANDAVLGLRLSLPILDKEITSIKGLLDADAKNT